MLLITEHVLETKSYLEEDKNGAKNLYIEGIFAQADKKNHNGRIYPKAILGREVARYNESHIKTRRALGELNHPQSPTVNPERASHLITALKESGSDFIGKAKILHTPMGNLVRGLVEDGVSMGVSTRGMGTVTEGRDANVVNEDFGLVTIDVVADPSAPSAFVNGIMECKGFVWEHNEQLAEKVMKQIKRMPASRVVEQQANMFSAFIKTL